MDCISPNLVAYKRAMPIHWRPSIQQIENKENGLLQTSPGGFCLPNHSMLSARTSARSARPWPTRSPAIWPARQLLRPSSSIWLSSTRTTTIWIWPSWPASIWPTRPSGRFTATASFPTIGLKIAKQTRTNPDCEWKRTMAEGKLHKNKENSCVNYYF